jgi:hypothetical protein
LDYVKDIPVEPGRDTGTGRALLEGKVIHIRDVLADPNFTWKEGQRLNFEWLFDDRLEGGRCRRICHY